MKGLLLRSLLILSLAQMAAAPTTTPAELPQLGANATSDELINALTPKSGTAGLKFRGLNLLTSNPATAKDGPMPAVALDIRFEINTARLLPEAKQTIRQLAIALKSEQLSKYHFLVEGHTDSTGRKAHNLALSKMRAELVRNELVEIYGIAGTRLDVIGRGQSQPLDPADPTNPANRRVQVINVGQ